jgi:hypothetical protein
VAIYAGHGVYVVLEFNENWSVRNVPL